MSNVFRVKTIKYERKEANKKKTGAYDIIGTKHNEIMNNLKFRKSGLSKLKNDLEIINKEIEQILDPQKCELFQQHLDKEIERIEQLIPKEEIKETKKSKNVKIININTTITDDKNENLNILNELKHKRNSLKQIFSKNCLLNELKEKRKNIKNEIYDLENNVPELEYFDKNLDILSEHCSNDQVVSNVKEVCVTDLFNDENLFKKNDSSKYVLVDKFLQSINETRRNKKVNLGKICKTCNIPKLLNTQESTFICEKCGEVEYVVMDSDKPSYNSNSEPKKNSYRRINHCSEILNQSQGKESTEITQELMDKIINELKIIGITDLSTVTKQHVKMVLKNIGESTRSEHAVFIANKLNGIAVQTIPHELVEIVKVMWVMIEEAWYIYKEPERKNFMNSSFLFHKIFELLDEPEEAAKWPYLADDKLKKYDILFKKICNHWGWPFYPSIN